METSDTTYAYQYAKDHCISVDCDHNSIDFFQETVVKQRNEYGLSANYSGIILPYELENQPVEILDDSIDELFCVIPSEFSAEILRKGFMITEHWKAPSQIYPEKPLSRIVFTKYKCRKYKKNFMRIRINMRDRAGIINLSDGSDRYHVLSLSDDCFIFSDAVLISPSNCLFLDHYVCSDKDVYGDVLQFGTSHENMIRHLVVPEGIYRIDAHSFAGNNILQTVYIGENVKYVGSNSFCDCQELYDVYIGKSVEGKGHDLFCNCPKLSHVTIANELGLKIFYCMTNQERRNASTWFQNCPNLSHIDSTGGTSISLQYWRNNLSIDK